MNPSSNEELFESRFNCSEFTPKKMTIRGIKSDPEVIDDYLRTVGYDLPKGYAESFSECLKAPSNPLSIPDAVRDGENDLNISDIKYYQILPAGNSKRISIKEEIKIDFPEGLVPQVTLSSERDSKNINLEISFDGKDFSADEIWEFTNRLSKLHSSTSLEGRIVERSLLETLDEVIFDDGVAVSFMKFNPLEKQTMPEIKESEKSKIEAYLVPFGIKLIGASEDIERSILAFFKSEDALHLYDCGAIKAMKDSLDDVGETPFKMLSNLTSQQKTISFTISHHIFLLSQEAYNERRFSEYGDNGEIALITPYKEQPVEYDDDGFENDLDDDSESFVFEADVTDDDLGELNISVVKKESIELDERFDKPDESDSVLEIMWDASVATQGKIWCVVFDCVNLLGIDGETFRSNIVQTPRPSVTTSDMTCGFFIEGLDCNAQIWLRPVLKEE